MTAGQECIARKSCTERTALDPSPTAEATLFIEPARTSPTANTPGTEVSNGSGLPAVENGWVSTSRPNDRSVSDEALLVEGDCLRHQRGGGHRADEAEQTRTLDSVRSPLGVCSRVAPARWVSPSSARDLGFGEHTDVRIGGDAIDQVAGHGLAERSFLRITTDTLQPPWLRKIAACPAELPPPTTITGRFPHDRDSRSVAA